MAINTILIEFELCQAAPPNGYRVLYRPIGGTIYREAGPFYSSPIQIVDTLDPLGTQYEGFIYSDCGGNKQGPQIPFTTSPGSVAESSVSESIIPPEFNWIWSASFNFSITAVTGTNLVALSPTGVNGTSSGNRIADFPGGNMQVDISGSIVTVTKLDVTLNFITLIDCQAVTGPGSYFFTGLPAVPTTDVLRVSINSGPC